MRRNLLTLLACLILPLAGLGLALDLTPDAAARIAADGTCVVTLTVNGQPVEYPFAEVYPNLPTPAVCQPSPTATSEPTATATATNTPVSPPSPSSSASVGVCGEDMMHWHAPLIGNCATGHEHGDAPPDWVLASRWMPMFEHPGNTPGENALKHSSFKGFTLSDDGVDVYVIMHLDTNPNGRSSRFHSVQVWARDAAGGISHWDYWADFGDDNNTGPNLRGDNCEDDDIRPIISVPYVDCPPLHFETWYSTPHRGGGPIWGFGFTVSAQYYNGTDPQHPSDPDLAAMATWLPTGGWNNVRRIEATWSGYDRTGSVYTTQWGRVVSGPADPLCGTPRTIGAKTYTTLCLEQYIAPTLGEVGFPGNSNQVKYPFPGVKLPN